MSDQKVVIFDWGGVLMRTEDYTPRHAWDARLGLHPGWVEDAVHGVPLWRWAQLGVVSIEEYWNEVADELGLDDKALHRLQQDFYSGDRLDKDLIALIRVLREEGTPIGLLSNNVSWLGDEIVSLGVEDLFDSIVISAEIGVMKPDAAAYQAILDNMNVPADKALFIDDFLHNVEGARAVGMSAIHFRPGMDLEIHIREWLQQDI